MKISEEKRIIIDYKGFIIRIDGNEITEAALGNVICTLEIICNVPILIFQFPKPYQITMIPVELTKNMVFGDFKQLEIRLELAGGNNGYVKEMLLSETDSNKIRQCRMNLPKQLHFGQAVAEYV